MFTNAALILFAISTTGTPGPNNIMMLTSGLNFGIRRSVPHWLGIITGVPIMLIALGLGLDQIFRQFPVLFSSLKVLGCGYLLYLAWKIAFMKVNPEPNHLSKKPMSYIQGLLFQWINPKAWVMCLSAISLFVDIERPMLMQILSIGFTFFLIGALTVGCWMVTGSKISQLLAKPQQQRIFNFSMAALLVVSLYPMLQV
jgi:threonine/homoserine/homoserine lactone efflux protein